MDAFSGFEKPKANFSPIPHKLIEQLPRFKTLAELKIVLYVLRHTWGYQDDYKKITLDEFENGRKTKEGARIDEGVGMTRPSIIAGIKQAIEDGFLYSHSDDNDKARVKKFYSITEQGLKDFTSDVKELNIGGKETLPRTEKETKRKKLEKESANKSQGERNRLFDGVAFLCFNIKADDETQKAVLEANSPRIGKIVSFLKKVESTPEKLWAFKQWYDATVKLSMPNDLAKFSKYYNEFLNGSASQTHKPTPPPVVEVISEEEQTSALDIIAAARQKVVIND